MPRHRSTDRHTPGRLWQLASFCLPLLLYVMTLAPTVTFEDSGSFITAARHLGVAHPSGYPLWCLIAHFFTLLPLGEIAQRVHLSSAVFAAATCWLVYLTALRLTSRHIASLAAALALGASRTLWSQAVLAEVYALNAFFAILVVYLALCWRDSKQTRWLLLLAFVSGLSLTNHPMIALVLVPLAVWILVRDWRRILSPRVLVFGGLLFFLGLTVYLYLPLRAAADPPVNWFKPDTLAKTVEHIQRKAYIGSGEDVRYLGQAGDVLRHTLASWRTSAEAFVWPLGAIAFLGLAGVWRRNRDLALASLVVFLCHTFLLNAYVHAQYTEVWRFAHRVYYIPGQVMMALWLAGGLAVVETWLEKRAGATGAVAGRRLVRASSLLLVVALLPLRLNFGDANLRDDRRAHDFGVDLMDVLPRGAGILPMGDTVIFTCLYLKYVEDFRTDVHILSPSFGWRGEKVTSLFGINPLTPGVVASFPLLEGFSSVPFGLGYLYLKNPDQALQVDADFQLLSRRPKVTGLLADDDDPFVEGVRATYAVYFARAGARAQALGQAGEAADLLDEAERLNPADPWVSYLLAGIYTRYGIRTDRVRPLLEDALERYDIVVDPAAQRHYAVSEDDIRRMLVGVAAEAEE